MYVSMEMPPIDLCKKFLMLHQKLSGAELEKVEEKSDVMLKVEEGLKEFKNGLPIYLFEQTGAVSIESVLEVCRLARKHHEIDLLVIDHLHYFGNGTGNRSAEVAKIMRSIK